MSLNFILPFALYVAIASPAMYKATRGIAGSWIASADGLATFAGLLLHALVFVLVVGYLMRMLKPYRSGFSDMHGAMGMRKSMHESNEIAPEGTIFPSKI
jgi:hypothetical protein